ncbi:hypothetical protein [Marmoricola sp. RAF53]|uniref:hypothetical protein n=1 Tax=Marmoricola sp. RAF53 TaxID=3233059 RepID=UPI003F9CD7DB
MTWSETHRRWRAMQEIETLVNASASGELPWNDEYAALFGDRDGLLAALRYRWELSVSAQLDTHLSEDALADQRRRLLERNSGVLRLIRRTPVPA